MSYREQSLGQIRSDEARTACDEEYAVWGKCTCATVYVFPNLSFDLICLPSKPRRSLDGAKSIAYISSPLKDIFDDGTNAIIVPRHTSQEAGTGLTNVIMKQAGLK